MDISEEKPKTPGTNLSRIYLTDSLGFPLTLADEDLYTKSKEPIKEEPESLDSDIPGSDLDEQEDD